MLTLNDGRAELWQWDTGRALAVDADCSQVHFSNKVFGRSIDVDVTDGVAIIPDILLQTDKDLNVWAFAGTAENGYTKISKTFKVNRRNKPADYVFTPPDQTTLAELVERLDKIEEAQDPDAIKNAVEDYLEQNPVEAPVQSVNGQTGTVKLTAYDVGAISQDDLQYATNEVLAQAKASGEFDGADGKTPEYGVDYGTPEQISEIAQAAAEILQPEVDQIKADLSANSVADAETRRKLDYLWKLNQGISYQFETDDTEAYSKIVPSGAKLVSVESVGGKTVVWNQLAGGVYAEFSDSGVTLKRDGWHALIDGEFTGSSTSYKALFNWTGNIVGHKYAFVPIIRSGSFSGTSRYNVSLQVGLTPNMDEAAIGTCKNTGTVIGVAIYPGAVYNSLNIFIAVVDLTAMLGAGNEPASVDDTIIAWIKQYAEANTRYQSRKLVSADAESVLYDGIVMGAIPDAVRALPGYGWSAGDVCNSIVRTDTGWQYVQRVGSRDYQDGDDVTDGVATYYAMETPVTTDITDMMADFPVHFEVEAGGAITLENAAKLPVPSTEKYLISLAEVNQ